jgi:large subunit ribosomal protein L24
MTQTWSKGWKASVQPKKQRKYIYNAPLHVVRNFFSVLLSKDLRTKYGKRNLVVRKGDRIKVLRGQFRGKSGKVLNVSYVRRKLVLEGVDTIKKDGSKIPYPVHPSNLMITELNLEDARRKKALDRK